MTYDRTSSGNDITGNPETEWKGDNLQNVPLFWHIYSMQIIKFRAAMLDMKNGSTKKRRPYREWCNDLRKWGEIVLQELSHTTLNRQISKQNVKMAADNN